MSVSFVFGRPGAGKTAHCLRTIATQLQADKTEAPLFFIVPEQFSLQAERLLLETIPAVMRVQAVSFGRLAYHLFARDGGGPGGRPVLDDIGKHMLLRKLLYDHADALSYYRRSADKPGFVDSLAQTVTELARYNITAQDLRQRSETAPDDSLSRKLGDLVTLLTHYREAVADRYTVTDDTLSLLAERMVKSDFFAGSFVWVDGFDGFTPQERKILGHIMRTARHVTFTLTAPEPPPPGKRFVLQPADFYYAVKETANQLLALAEANQVLVHQAVGLRTDHRHKNHSAALGYFTAHGDTLHMARRDKTTPVPAVGSEIRVIAARDRYDEIHEAARLILQYIRTGWRFRDIAILCGDPADCDKIMRPIFDAYDIPLFVDVKTDILSHPLTELIRAAVDIVAYNWQYEGVFRCLRTGLTDLARDDADRLENYVLAHGIKRYRWQQPWPEPEAETQRLRVLQMLSPFTEGLHADKKETVLSFAKRIFALLYALDVPGKLTKWYEVMSAAGDHETARRHRQIWPKVCEIFDKLTDILGEEPVTARALTQLLDAGFTRADLGVIPPTVDQVMMGDISRSRFPDVKALIVLGANDGSLPPLSTDNSLFTDDDRETLCQTGLELAPVLSRRVSDDHFRLYRALAAPKDALIFLYSRHDLKGAILRPAGLLAKLTKMFPSLREEAATPPDTVPIGGEVWAMPDKLSPVMTEKLYGAEVLTGASALESYATCPFAHFITYALQVSPRALYQARAIDLGILYHEVLAMVSRVLCEKGAWRTIDADELAALVDACVETIVPGGNAEQTGHVLRSSSRNENILARVKRICARSAWALAEHIKRGAFEPSGLEIAFKQTDDGIAVRLNDKRRLVLTGRIDRVDIYTALDEKGRVQRYIKIIDYKSGATKFDLEDVYDGTQLQLLLYMNALLQNGGRLSKNRTDAADVVNTAGMADATGDMPAIPGGVFYFNIDDPILQVDGVTTPEERDKLLLKCFRMSGLALAETETVRAIDAALASGGDSVVIPVSVKTDGAFGKRSAVVGRAGFAMICADVNEKIKSLGQQMTDGVITPSPRKKKNRSGCDYCDYKAICGYDIFQLV